MTDYVKVRISFLATSAGGRSTEAILQASGGAQYRAHFRVGAEGEYLAVAFLEGNPSTVFPGQESEATVALVYSDEGVDYSSLLPGVGFELVEGTRVVARGAVLERWQEDRHWSSRPAV